MQEQEVITTLRNTGTLMENGHFDLGPKGHSSEFLNAGAFYPHTFEFSIMAEELGERFANNHITAVIGAGEEGAVIAHSTALALTRKLGYESTVHAIYARMNSRGEIFVEREHQEITAKLGNILVVEGFLTSESMPLVKSLIDSLKDWGGKVFGFGTFFSHVSGNPRFDLEVPKFEALAQRMPQAWKAKDCHLCKSGLPLNEKFGHNRTGWFFTL